MIEREPSPAAYARVALGGAFLGVVTSGGIVVERLSSGSPNVAVVVKRAIISVAAILLLALVQRHVPLSAPVASTELFGAAAGVALVHVTLRAGLIDRPYWLSERPPQLVNDAVAVLSLLVIVWACTRRLNLRLLVVALFVLTLYRITGPSWHLDAPPLAFALSVQDIVIGQLVAAALALPLYRQMTKHSD